MGDLNDDPMDRSCAKVIGAGKDKEGVGEHGFYNPWWRILDRGIGTLAYKSSWNLFDQIIVSGNLDGIRLCECGRRTLLALYTFYPCEHVPVCVGNRGTHLL